MTDSRCLFELEIDGICYTIKRFKTISCQPGRQSRDFPRNSVCSHGREFSPLILTLSEFSHFFFRTLVLPREVTTICPSSSTLNPPMAYAVNTRAFESESKLMRIDNAAFYCWPSLKSVYIPSGVQFHGKLCFGGCSSLESVTFGPGSRLAAIGKEVFTPCSRLPMLSLPASLEAIHVSSLPGAITSLIIEPGSRHFSVCGRFLLDADGNRHSDTSVLPPP
jgi:hypothetical protein